MQPKGRPKKYRIIKKEPEILKFSPRGKPGRPEEIELNIEEFEAIRLTDHQGLRQDQAAKSMGISQQTVSRVLRKARKKMADTLIGGKIIKIKGGRFIIKSNHSMPAKQL